MSLKSLSQILQKHSNNEQYKSEEWQSFSRRVRHERDSCEVCKRADVRLNVHHFAYDPNRDLWDYGDNEIAVLCEACHQAMHERLQEFRRFVFGYFTPASMKVFNGALAAAANMGADPLKLSYAIAEMVASPRSVENFCNAWINKPVNQRPKAQPQPPAAP